MTRLALAAAVLLVACSNGGAPPASRPVSTPPAIASTPPALEPVSPAPVPGVTAPPPTRSTAIGSRLTLRRGDGSAIDVNAIEVVDPARGRVVPPEGTRWVAVRIEISNPGGPAYTETPADGARMIDAEGNVYAGWSDDPVRPGFGGDITIRTGDFERAFVSFSLPDGVRPHAVRFTPESRTAPETGEWRL